MYGIKDFLVAIIMSSERDSLGQEHSKWENEEATGFPKASTD
jgi:hypothetical protein